MSQFNDEDLLAFADEQLSADRCALVEQMLRQDAAAMSRLRILLTQRDQGAHTVGEIWRRQRLSCPSRAVWAAYLDGRLGDGLKQYLQFHINIIGCRMCHANLSDLKRSDSAMDIERRSRKIFQSSAGHLPRNPM